MPPARPPSAPAKRAFLGEGRRNLRSEISISKRCRKGLFRRNLSRGNVFSRIDPEVPDVSRGSAGYWRQCCMLPATLSTSNRRPVQSLDGARRAGAKVGPQPAGTGVADYETPKNSSVPVCTPAVESASHDCKADVAACVSWGRSKFSAVLVRDPLRSAVNPSGGRHPVVATERNQRLHEPFSGWLCLQIVFSPGYASSRLF